MAVPALLPFPVDEAEFPMPPPVRAFYTLAELIRWLLCVRFLPKAECEGPFCGTDEVDVVIVVGCL